MHGILFLSHLSANEIEQIHDVGIALAYKIHLGSRINSAGCTLLTDSHKIIYPVLGQNHTKLNTLLRTDR